MNATSRPLETALERTFEAVLFDWDGTAVADRQADAAAVRERVEALCAAGVHVIVVTGTHLGNVDGQLHARPSGPGRLLLCLNRGSEVFAVGRDGPSLLWRRAATSEEDAALDRAAAATVAALARRGLVAEVVSERLNRRKIDLIPEPAWADPPKARIAELLDAVTTRLQSLGIDDLAAVVDLATRASTSVGLAAPRISSDVKHVEIGLTDKADAARWAARWLADRGITGSLILVGGDEFGPVGGVTGSDARMLVDELRRSVVVSVGAEPNGCPTDVLHLAGGPPRFLALLDTQLQRRRDRRVPSVDDDPAWIVPLPASPHLARVAESLGTVANGWTGTRGSLEEDGPGAVPLFLANGSYRSDESAALLAGPHWTLLQVPPRTTPGARHLDLRGGLLVRDADDPAGLRSIRFASIARPRALALRAESREPGLAPCRIAPDERSAPGTADSGAPSAAPNVAAVGEPGGPTITVAAVDDVVQSATGCSVVERLATWRASDRGPAPESEVLEELGDVSQAGFDLLLAEHRAGWARRWEDARVDIEGAPDDELAARFAVFHLLCAAPDSGEAAVGARGLTGPAYGGHVFWDADVFVLPALAALRPSAARAMLEYRRRRLPAAQAAARARGCAGARFPWESAASGADVTPQSVRGPDGELVVVRTGEHEEHVVADVAWAASEYAGWSGDSAFMDGAGEDLVIEPARWWASRIRRDRGGRGHLHGVMGPDEYHEVVDDNAFTNVMARWNLRRAAQLVEARPERDQAEAARWRDLAAALIDGYDARTGVYEQFAGYHRLEPLLVSEVGEPPVAADVVLGPKRTAGSQIIKQADVLMLHHLLPDEVAPGSLEPNLAFYEPRTAHGSSLSPAIHAALLARAGQTGRALELFRLAATLDLADVTGTTAGGLHLATMGGLWQALAYGFLGLRPGAPALQVDPRLPAEWRSLSLRLRYRGQRITVRAEGDLVTVSCDRPLAVRVGAAPARRCDPPGRTFAVKGDQP